VRFNTAAETMFGYKSAEIVGKNIKMCMPERFGVNHQEYINNYLNTGLKKAIGNGRRVLGLKKDGTEFPIHLSVTELKEEGNHLFTGIARDLTVQEEEQHYADSTETQVPIIY
jgi:PAS domain S-box-containing protein